MSEKREYGDVPGQVYVLVNAAIQQARMDGREKERTGGAAMAKAAQEVIYIAYDEECMFDQRCHERLPDGKVHAETCPLERLRAALEGEVTP